MRCVHTSGNVCVGNTCRLIARVTQSLRSMRLVITTQCAGAVGASGFVQWLRLEEEVTAHVHPLVANVRRVQWGRPAAGRQGQILWGGLNWEH